VCTLPLTVLLLVMAYGSLGIAAHNMLWVLWLLWGRAAMSYERAVPGPRCYGPRGHTELPSEEFSLRPSRARGSASIANYFLFCPQVKFNNINLPLLRPERWLQIAHNQDP